MNAPPTVLYVDPAPEHRRPVAEAFNRAGIPLRYVNDVAQTLRGIRALEPQLLLLNAEVRSGTTTQVLDALASDEAFAHLPVVLICRDLSDRRFLHQLRTGIVELLEAPFSEAVHVAGVRALWAELPNRVGTVSGRGDSRELAALVEHLRRTQRSGALTVSPHPSQEGKAHFVRGALERALYQGAGGVEALLGMVTTPAAAWSFSELEAEPTPILLVDDDETLCRMFSLLFRKHGFEVRTAPDGLAGHEAARAQTFELVVADLSMPRMDGWGMLKLLRDDHCTRELPVVFLSAHDDYRENLRALDAGAQGYFSKSTRMEALVPQLRGVLEPRRALRALLLDHHTLEVAIGTVGPQWLVKEIARAKLSGRIEAQDSWASYQITFWDGRPVHASAQAGPHLAAGERAFNAFLDSRGAGGTFERGEFPATENLVGSEEDQIARACALLNEREARLRDNLLVAANDLRVDGDLYALYAQVGPRQWLETARLICEERLSPREVIATVNASPIEVEDTLKDLVRRGVVTLSA